MTTNDESIEPDDELSSDELDDVSGGVRVAIADLKTLGKLGR